MYGIVAVFGGFAMLAWTLVMVALWATASELSSPEVWRALAVAWAIYVPAAVLDFFTA